MGFRLLLLLVIAGPGMLRLGAAQDTPPSAEVTEPAPTGSAPLQQSVTDAPTPGTSRGFAQADQLAGQFVQQRRLHDVWGEQGDRGTDAAE